MVDGGRNLIDYQLLSSRLYCLPSTVSRLMFYSMVESISWVSEILSNDNERLVGQPILRLQEEIAKTKANNNTIADSFLTLFVFIV